MRLWARDAMLHCESVLVVLNQAQDWIATRTAREDDGNLAAKRLGASERSAKRVSELLEYGQY
jgi:hypothetical protein